MTGTIFFLQISEENELVLHDRAELYNILH